MKKIVLTAAQQTAYTAAVHNFIDQRTIGAGRGAVVLLPEFREVNGEWVPVLEGMGCRPTSKTAMFLRFAKVAIASTGSSIKKNYVYTNLFGDTEQDLANTLLMVDPTAVIGGVVKNVRLVVHESLVPFNKTNPMNDIKWADQAAGIACRVEDQPIYRKAMVFFADDYGGFEPKAMDIKIQHTNTEELSINWAKNNAANTAGIKNKASEVLKPQGPTVQEVEARLDELEAIEEGKRTRAQKTEIKTLTANLAALETATK